MGRYFEIEQLVARSMFVLDSADAAASAALFSERATVYGATGPREILRLFEEAHAVEGVAQRRHAYSNFQIVSDDGDQVTTQHVMVLYIIRGKAVEAHTVGVGTTIVVWEDEQWKILDAGLKLDSEYFPGDRPLQLAAGTVAGRTLTRPS